MRLVSSRECVLNKVKLRTFLLGKGQGTIESYKIRTGTKNASEIIDSLFLKI